LGKLKRKKRLVIYRHIIRERRTRFWREVEEDALKLAFVAEHLARTTKKRKESDDGHYSGGFWVVDLDETRPRSARVLLVLGKDILEEGATSTTRISLQLESRFIIPNRFRSLSLSRRVGGEYNGVVFARGKNATLTLKITSPFVRASSRSSRWTRRGRGASCQAHRATTRTTRTTAKRRARPPRRAESDRSRTIFRNNRKNTHHTEKNTGIIGRMDRQMKKTGSAEHLLLLLRFPKRTRAKWRGTGCVLLEDKDNRRRLIFKKLNTTRDEGKTPLWAFEVLY
tara:strand:+ start:63 stop:911 length:849 start_codon:yes stop_codon:yes gene_type:complete